MHILFSGSRILVREEGGLYLPALAPGDSGEPHAGPLRVEAGGTWAQVRTWPETLPPPAGTRLEALRPVFPVLAAAEADLAGRARQLLQWRQHHRHCGRCGTVTTLSGDGSALRCPECGLQQFPRVSPAVIVLVHDGGRILLGRAPRWPDGMYSTLAGFVEPGESAEEALLREVREESGVEVDEPRYFGSQSWPFPNSLMLGYFARYRGGEIRRDDEELEDVRWFTRDSLPSLPPRISIARQLIEAFLEGPVG